MSEQAPERPARAAGGGAPPRDGKGSNILTRPVGPFPLWVWLAVVGGLLGWRLLAGKKTAASAAADTTASSTPADQVPQFVNQTYTTVTAPPAPRMTAPPAPPWHSGPMMPGPATISGAPGSYTTGLGGGKLDEWTSTGQYSLNVIAKSHGMTVQQLIQSSLGAEHNVGLMNYIKYGNYNAKVPAGVHLFFPAQYWNQPLRKVG